MVERGDASGAAYVHNHTASLDNFPELWTEILKHVPQEDRLRHVPLVSRRFREACRDPSLWRELSVLHSTFLTKARWRSFLSWLAARASRLHKLDFADDNDPSLSGNTAAVWERRAPQLIALLAASAPQLRSLEHRYLVRLSVRPASALPAELGRLRQLTSLRLFFGHAAVTTAQVNAMVLSLPSLRHFAIFAGWSGALWEGFPVGIATSCNQLRHLKICGCQLGALPSELGCLKALTALLLLHAGVTSLPDSISRLSALVNLDLSGNSDVSLPFGLTACRQLTRLDIEPGVRSPV